MANFDQFFNKVLKAEGGYVNNPADRGGETYAGVSSKYFPADVARLKQMRDAGQDTTPYLKDFYKREFWDKSGAESVPEEMRLAYADTAVNSGIGKAKELLNNSSNLDQFLDNRQGFVNKIVENDPTQAAFQKGWGNRIEGLRANDAMVGGDDSLGQYTEIEAPDGTILEFPSTMSEEDILGVMRKQFSPALPQEKPKTPSGILQGLGDAAAGAGQFVPRALEQITSLGGLAKNPISELYKQSYERTGDPYAKKREQDYQEKRKASGENGLDVGRIVGNVANPINYVGGVGMLPTLARGAGFGALQPVENTENYGDVKAAQIGFGTLGAGAGKVVGDKLIAPVGQRSMEVARLLKEKVPLTIGQTKGGITQAIENKLTSIPFLGDSIKAAQGRSTEGLNKAAYTRILNSVGEKPPSDLGVGRNAINYVGEKVSQKYDNLLPKLTGKVDNAFNTDIKNIKNMVQADDIMNAAEKSKYAKIMANALSKRVTNNNITGEAIKDIESELGEKASKLAVGDVSQRQLADALKESQKALRSMVERSNPQYSKELSSINKAYAQLLRVERAAVGAGNESGVFTPAQLQAAVKALDKSKGSRQFARGNALMQDLSESGKNVLPNNIPNSGTVDRGLMFGLGSAGLYGGGEYTNNDYMKAAALALAPTLLYTKAGVGATNAISSGLRNKTAQALLKPIGQSLPYMSAPLVTPIAGK